ncbi:hypothetical protein SLS59_006137 [Nothophoma quercina]|uniref:Uncharacterized protein n=1 Tax=Nothophoma quercina TaxID=749835 RepID=A0ABR3R714_9PLEO
MPVHSAEETTSGSITDQVAKESKDSNASTHELHQEDNQATSGGSVAANAHKANPVRSSPSLLDRIQHVGWTLTGRQGPVHADNLPEPASKEELKKRAEELNK